jgi:hypothetical protein
VWLHKQLLQLFWEEWYQRQREKKKLHPRRQGAVEEAVPFWTMAEEQKIVALPAPSAGRQILVMKLPVDFSEIK